MNYSLKDNLILQFWKSLSNHKNFFIQKQLAKISK